MTPQEQRDADYRNGFRMVSEEHGFYERVESRAWDKRNVTILVYDDFMFACSHVEPARFMAMGTGETVRDKLYTQAAYAERRQLCSKCHRWTIECFRRANQPARKTLGDYRKEQRENA